MKKFFKKRKNFILIILSACTAMAGIAFGWYAVDSLVSADAQAMQVDSIDILTVKVLAEDGNSKEKVPLTEVANGSKIIDIGLANLTNVEEGKIAPGAFGEIHFYVTATSPYYNGCRMKIKPTYNFVNNLGTSITIDELKQTVDSHILFFTDKNVDDVTNQVTYSGKISFDDGSDYLVIERVLSQNIEEEIVVYWYWPYDFNEALPYIDGNSNISQSGTEEENIRQYDIFDTMIGNYLESVKLSFDIKGIQSN